jgi:hypothetical protein
LQHQRSLQHQSSFLSAPFQRVAPAACHEGILHRHYYVVCCARRATLIYAMLCSYIHAPIHTAPIHTCHSQVRTSACPTDGVLLQSSWRRSTTRWTCWSI